MIKKIKVEELKAGMFVHGLAKVENGKDKAFMNTVQIHEPGQIKGLVAEGYRYAFVDETDIAAALKRERAKELAKGLNGFEPSSKEKTERIDSWELPTSTSTDSVKAVAIEPVVKNDELEHHLEDSATFDNEVVRAREIKEKAGEVLKDLLDDVRSGKGMQTDKAKKVVEGVVDSVLRNQDAMLSLVRLKEYDDYTFGHSVNVSIISTAFGRHIGLDRRRLLVLGFGSILHDVGKMLVPDKILNKPSVLTEEEFMIMKSHPVLGSDLLKEEVGIPREVVNIARHHHERFNGSGYPDGLAGNNIETFARMVAIADVYDAMTTKRVYGDTPNPGEAVKRLFSWKGTHFDPHLVDTFVGCLGIYPIGSFVRLNTGQVALVKRANRVSLLQPLVVVLYDKNGMKYPKVFDLDLAKSRDKNIVATVSSSEFKINVDEYIG